MRINAPPPPVFSVPESSAVPEVVTLRAVRPIGEETGGQSAGAGTQAMPPPLPEPASPGESESVEKRQAADAARRIDDRRKRQIPVLIDTRSGKERRRSARRDTDPPPAGGSIDVKA